LLSYRRRRHVTGQPSTEYVSEETPMAAYANLHIAFEQMRVRALRDLRGSPVPEYEREKPTDPPRVLVLGPENSGKTTVCKLLINYAVRAGQGWSPLLINTDPAEVTFLFFLCGPSLTEVSGWLGSTRRPVCRACTQSASYVLSGEPPRSCRNIRPDRIVLQRPATARILVRPCGI
jgi:polyribonucleotide 5'-hydroxyl-kinase